MTRLHLAIACWLISAGGLVAGPPATVVVHRPDGGLLVGIDRQVVRVDPSTGLVVERMHFPGPVTAIALSADGATLAVAAGQPGRAGIVRVIRGQDVAEFAAHTDAVYGLAISGDRLISAGYDKQVAFVTPKAGRPATLGRDHSDAIHGLSAQPGGPLVATCAADRTVKLWHRDSAERLYSLTDATDWLYAVTFSPDGKRVAAGGVDRSIRVWDVSPTESKLVASFFAHDAAVLRLAFSPDGATLYSLGEDRALKSWDWRARAERKPMPRLTADPLAMSLSKDGKQIAVARHDGTISLHDSASGEVRRIIAVPLTDPPKVVRVEPAAAPRGRTTAITLHGERLAAIREIRGDSGITANLRDGAADRRVLDLSIAADAKPGPIQLTAVADTGSVPIPLHVDLFPERPAGDGEEPVAILDTSMAGTLARPGAARTYQYTLMSGYEFGALVTPTAGSRLEPALRLIDPEGRVIAEGTATLAGIAATAGVHRLELRDRDYRGGPSFGYRIHAGAVPVASGVFPLGLGVDSAATVEIVGVNLPRKTAEVAAGDTHVGGKLPLDLGGAFGSVEMVVGGFPEVTSNRSPLRVPSTANGRLVADGQADLWPVRLRAGEPIVVEALARRHGSPLDPTIELLDSRQRPVLWTRLQCLAKTSVVLRDVSATSPSLRLESWNELAVNDLMLIGREVIKIRELPGHPDADCSFYAVDGKRQTFFGTTPSLHPLGAPIFKVKPLATDEPAPSNGYPVVPIYYRNDDGGAGYGHDARMLLTVPTDGDYFVRVADARGRSGANFAYRLTVRPARPDFAVRLGASKATVARGQSTPITVVADRRDGFAGPIRVRLEGLPAGFACHPATIAAGHHSVSLIVAATGPVDAKAKARPRLIGEAEQGDALLSYSVAGPQLQLEDAADVAVFLETPEVRLAPGHEVAVPLRIERRGDFRGRVPMEVRGLPHGVTVLHVGLNGVLVTEKESTRSFTIGAEPWVPEGDYAITVVAKNEAKNTARGAPPILLMIRR